MTFPMRAFTALVRKDLVLYFSNRRALIVTIVAPIAIAAFFGYLFGGTPDKGPSRIAIAITDLDASPLSQKIVAALAADSSFDIKTMGEAEAADAVKRGKLRAAITFPKGFGDHAPCSDATTSRSSRRATTRRKASRSRQCAACSRST